MKVRKESRGLHFYDRITGLHILADEVRIPCQDRDEAPEVISIAVTNVCDLSCAFCYAPKSRDMLSVPEIIQWCRELDQLGTLEVAFGGGEPTLFPGLAEACRTIWTQTRLGISITTHGHRLNEQLWESLKGFVSIVRVSIDAPEPLYSSIRGLPLARAIQNICQIEGQVPIGINTVVNAQTLRGLDELAVIVRDLGAIDWLLLPEIKNGTFTLSDSEWQRLDNWIISRAHDLNLRTTTNAKPHLTGPFLLEDAPEDYAHISANGYLRRCSYQSGGISLRDRPSVLTALRELKLKQLSLAGASQYSVVTQFEM
jgi:MoaA/NifB/PqqE/SkfB family radical SAM enzyme